MSSIPLLGSQISFSDIQKAFGGNNSNLNTTGNITTKSSYQNILNGNTFKLYAPEIFRTALATGNGRYFIGIKASNAIIKISIQGTTNYNIYWWSGMVLNTTTLGNAYTIYNGMSYYVPYITLEDNGLISVWTFNMPANMFMITEVNWWN